MKLDLVTKEDLSEFKSELINAIEQLIKGGDSQQQKKWLRSAEVRKILKISPGTLQNLRINGVLSFTKVGSIFYYKLDDINAIMDGEKNE
ncbi:helix-turn-helix domain-containing protein [Pedobacter sp. MC2016-05]|uniref:helix-turn-helix domain-containing protein n=1 Tax=Pedobacter sp. MC2016-05 TaxID=2994474 RepID=UPI002247798B|nr:helix-turn-helix domain-containing protein [Pedobacter sp. MC2016-05]MCX2476098.1 helix-turn-helix domain-containing protein [Pedobacter sp. MC2016-05]